jgi:hypothetical protein
MDTAKIDWSETIVKLVDIDQSKNPYLDKKGFYAILTGKFNSLEEKFQNIKLRYIGQAYRQTLRIRVPQDHIAYKKIEKYLKNNPDYEPLVMLGIISEHSKEKLTYQFIDDIEACLIFSNKPDCNTKNIDSYDGRDIKVINTGDYCPLDEISKCKKEKDIACNEYDE